MKKIIRFLLIVILIVLAIYIVSHTIGKLMPWLQEGMEAYSIEGVQK